MNVAKSKGLIRPEDYPFGLDKYIIPGGENNKIALEIEDVKKLWEYLISCIIEQEHYYLSMWFFGLMANGINPKDIANLMYKKIQDNCFVIIRQKVRRTSHRKQRPIVIPILEPMQMIMDKYGNPEKKPDNYIFNIIQPGLSIYRQKELVSQFCNLLGDWVHKICPKAGVENKAGGKEYRHTFGTFLKYAGYTFEFIMEQYGHTDLRTTLSYLADNKADSKRAANMKIFGKFLDSKAI